MLRHSYFGYTTRKSNDEENCWFKKNISISGFASEDKFIVLNPYAKLNSIEMNAVCLNEAIRLFMRDKTITPKIKLTKRQIDFFKNTAYEGCIMEMKQTIIARIISGDPSAQNFTPSQRKVADEIYTLAQNN
jgi:DNA-binding sugar fermentation-stimulating protein